jgi:hypothetical protein
VAINRLVKGYKHIAPQEQDNFCCKGTEAKRDEQVDKLKRAAQMSSP